MSKKRTITTTSDISTATAEGILLIYALSKLAKHEGVTVDQVLASLVSRAQQSNVAKWAEVTGEQLPNELAMKDAATVPAPTHHIVHDNSDGFRDFLDKKKIPYLREGHYTSIQMEVDNRTIDLFALGKEYAIYRTTEMAKANKQLSTDTPQ